MIEQGDDAPDFELPDEDGRAVKLSDLRGQPLVVYFYPKADTPATRRHKRAARLSRRCVGLCLVVLLLSALAVGGTLAAGTATLHPAIETEGEPQGYSLLWFFGRCPAVPVEPARVTFAGSGQRRTITIRDPCKGEWKNSGRYSLPGLAITPHPAHGPNAASLEFGVFGQTVGRHTYTLTAAYAGQTVKATIEVVVTAGRGPGQRGYRFAVKTNSKGALD